MLLWVGSETIRLIIQAFNSILLNSSRLRGSEKRQLLERSHDRPPHYGGGAIYFQGPWLWACTSEMLRWVRRLLPCSLSASLQSHRWNNQSGFSDKLIQKTQLQEPHWSASRTLPHVASRVPVDQTNPRIDASTATRNPSGLRSQMMDGQLEKLLCRWWAGRSSSPKDRGSTLTRTSLSVQRGGLLSLLWRKSSIQLLASLQTAYSACPQAQVRHSPEEEKPRMLWRSL